MFDVWTRANTGGKLMCAIGGLLGRREAQINTLESRGALIRKHRMKCVLFFCFKNEVLMNTNARTCSYTHSLRAAPAPCSSNELQTHMHHGRLFVLFFLSRIVLCSINNSNAAAGKKTHKKENKAYKPVILLCPFLASPFCCRYIARKIHPKAE